MGGGTRRIARHLARRQHLEIYVVAIMSLVLAVLSLVGDLVDDDVRWAVVLAALGLLTYQIAAPTRTCDLDEVLRGRESFDEVTFSSRLKQATEVWIFGASAVNLLTADTANHLRQTVLNRRDGIVRIMVLDPAADSAVGLAAQQLDDSTDYVSVHLPRALATTVDRIEMMSGWDVAGSFEYRYASLSPGFSLVGIDPHRREGLLIVEFHGVYNESTATRMHLELTPAGSQRWFAYWRNQFQHFWTRARPPTAPDEQSEL